MDEQEGGSSTGMVIGMIIGGGVVLLLVVLVVFGAGFFFLGQEANVAFAPVAAPAVAPPRPAWVAEDAAPPPAPPMALAQTVKGRDRLIGTWEAKTLDEGQATLEFLADGTLRASATQPGKADGPKTQGRWEVLEEAGDRLKLRRTAADNTDSVQNIRFDAPDRFVIEGQGGGATYTRKVQ
jgi:hypothetical protein